MTSIPPAWEPDRRRRSSDRAVGAVSVSAKTMIASTDAAAGHARGCCSPPRGVRLAAEDLEPRAARGRQSARRRGRLRRCCSNGKLAAGRSFPSIEDVNARIGVLTAGVGQTFDLRTRTALITVAVPDGVGGPRVLGPHRQAVRRRGDPPGRGQRPGATVRRPVGDWAGLRPRPRPPAQRPHHRLGESLTVGAPTGENPLPRPPGQPWVTPLGLPSPRLACRCRSGAGMSMATPASGSSAPAASSTQGRRVRTQNPVLATQGHAS